MKGPKRISKWMAGLFFTIPVLLLAGTKMGYIPLSETRMIDIAAIPALFAAICGGYAITIPLVFVWSFITFFFEKNAVEHYTFLGLMVINSVYLFGAIFWYRFLERYLQSAMHTLYCVVIISFSMRTLTMTLPFFTSLGLYHQTLPFDYYTVITCILEIALSLVAIHLSLKHLHAIHIENEEKRGNHARQSLPRNM